MVGLRRTDGHEGARSTGNGITAKELELAGLVAATPESGQVIPFDPHPRTIGERTVRVLNRSGQRGEAGSFEMVEHALIVEDLMSSSEVPCVEGRARREAWAPLSLPWQAVGR